MVRSLYAGVTGMKAHQSRMDVIGNNIANVNTFGFKSSRATFSDVYYQTVRTASAGTASQGGVNASQIGYGSKLRSVDLMMTRSSFTMTDSTMDLAIDGDGFFQVQDMNGNRYYTRAGQLSFDSAGNLIDSNGSFVLGVSGNPLGVAAGSNKIQLQIPPVNPTQASAEEIINNVTFNVNAANTTKDGNVSIQFIQGVGMTDGVRAKANVGTSGIVVTVNSSETFSTLADFNDAVNSAITEACMASNGQAHPAGDFTIVMDPSEKWPAGGLTGEEICSTDFAVKQGKIEDWTTTTIAGGLRPNGETGSEYSGAGALDGTSFDCTYDENLGFEVSVEIGGTTYSGYVDSTRTSSGTMKLMAAGGSENDYIVFSRPAYSVLESAAKAASGNDPLVDGDSAINATQRAVLDGMAATSTPATESKSLGLSSKNIILSGGTEGGAQTQADLTGIVVGSDGVITAKHAILGDITVGRIDLVNFSNAAGLTQAGNSYFTTSANSGDPILSQAGQGGVGQLAGASLEMSNVDLSREFSDMITTQRGFQANSRIITVSDTMLEELVNLKR